MRSAIPVALLFMIVNWSERKQGSGPKRDEVLLNTGGLHPFICSSIHLFLSGLESALSGLKYALSGLNSALSGLESK